MTILFRILLVGLTISIFTAINLSSGAAYAQTKQNKNENKVKKKYQQGVEYSWWPADDNAGCKSSENKICLTNKEYKEMCLAAKSISKGGVQWRITFSNSDEKQLLESGNFEDIQVVWSKSMIGKEQCYGAITASGIINGNSTRKTMQGIVKQFIVNEKNQILVSAFDLW